MSKKNPSSHNRKEEIRGLFVLGLLAVLSSIRIQHTEMMVEIGQTSFIIGCVAIALYIMVKEKVKLE